MSATSNAATTETPRWQVLWSCARAALTCAQLALQLFSAFADKYGYVRSYAAEVCAPPRSAPAHAPQEQLLKDPLLTRIVDTLVRCVRGVPVCLR